MYMYKLGVKLMKLIMVVLAVAAIMSYYSQELTVTTIGFIIGAVTSAFFYVLMAVDLRNKRKNQPTASFPFLEREELDVPAPALPLAERPVMWYDGQIYDYFGTADPTAPNPA